MDLDFGRGRFAIDSDHFFFKRAPQLLRWAPEFESLLFEDPRRDVFTRGSLQYDAALESPARLFLLKSELRFRCE